MLQGQDPLEHLSGSLSYLIHREAFEPPFYIEVWPSGKAAEFDSAKRGNALARWFESNHLCHMRVWANWYAIGLQNRMIFVRLEALVPILNKKGKYHG